MLARTQLPPEFAVWNHKWAAPYGRQPKAFATMGRAGPTVRDVLRHQRFIGRGRGPFAFQPNTSTRTYEYPWVYHQLAPRGPGRTLDIGGALAGMQFVLATEGCEVHNVDPLSDNWVAGKVDPEQEHAIINRNLHTNVVLHRATLAEAGLSGKFDSVYCISTIEHLSHEDLETTLKVVKELLAPGGLLVLTIDLFINLQPFCSRESNLYGTNANIAEIEDILGYEMVAGDRRELNGYPEFSSDAVLSYFEDFMHHPVYPQLAQLVTFRAPGA